jgi:DNA-binding CsgD family transcriptional regulator
MRVTELVERGLSNREIVAILRRSPNTVRNQLVAIFKKLDVSTRSELVFVRCHRDMS